MAKDYFQDILPPGNDRPVPSSPPPTQSPSAAPTPQTRATPIEIKTEAPMPERSIRNIAVSSRPRPAIDIREPLTPQRPKPGRSRSTVVLWSVAGVAIVGLIILGFVATRPTTVTITPRTHNVTFDQTSVFTAYPAQSAATGTLSYTVQKIDIEDSEAVASNGVTHVEEKASGSVTVYNDFATTPVKLVKNTRFATPDGLIFRTPADVLVPGKKGTTPGSVVITVVADAAGQSYNVGPLSRLSLPGLASNAAMSTGVYAKSSAAFSGGFSGDKPGVALEVMNAAISAMRGRLSETAVATLAKLPNGTALRGLSQITYEELPATSDSPAMTRLHERAHIQAVVFPESALAASIAQSTGSDIQSATMHLKPAPSFDASYVASSTPSLGTDLIAIMLTGSATVVWDVDTVTLAQALANHDKGAFNTIVNGFTGVQEAHARIEPFWSSRFPSNPTSIRMIVEAPKTP